MVNLKVFDKKHPNSEQNRACVRSKDLLARIDKINVSGGTEKEISEVESLLRTSSIVFPAPYLLCDLYNTTGIGKATILKTEPEKPAKENTKKPNNPVPPTNPENENPDAGKDDGIENPTVSPAESETPTEATQPVETPDEQKFEENTMETETPDENPIESPAESETPAETVQPAEVSDEPQSEENTMETETPDENPTESPAESETPAEDTTEAPAESAQPKTRRSRKKAEEAAE